MGIPGPMARAGEGVDIPDLMARAGEGWVSKGPCLEGYPRSDVQEEGAVYATMWPIRRCT